MLEGGSTGTDLNGNAMVLACEDLASKLAPIREANPNIPWEQVCFLAYLQRIPLTAYGYYNRSQVEHDRKTNKGTCFLNITQPSGLQYGKYEDYGLKKPKLY